MEFDYLQLYEIDTEIDPRNGGYGTFDEYDEYNGLIYNPIQFREIDRSGVNIDSWWFSKKLFKPVSIEDRILKEDSRTYTDFKVGDLVKIRTITNLKEHYKSTDRQILTMPITWNINEIAEIQGEMAEILAIDGDICRLGFINNKINNRFRYDIFCLEILEIVEEGYRDRIMANSTKVVERTEIDDDIIAEMISKVDIRKMKKIMASSLRIKATELKGIEKMLQDWAIAKKNIYLLFGRNLTLRKHIEYEMTDRDVNEKRYLLMQKFPILNEIISNIDITDFKQNKLNNGFCDYYKEKYDFVKRRNECKYVSIKSN